MAWTASVSSREAKVTPDHWPDTSPGVTGLIMMFPYMSLLVMLCMIVTMVMVWSAVVGLVWKSYAACYGVRGMVSAEKHEDDIKVIVEGNSKTVMIHHPEMNQDWLTHPNPMYDLQCKYSFITLNMFHLPTGESTTIVADNVSVTVTYDMGMENLSKLMIYVCLDVTARPSVRVMGREEGLDHIPEQVPKLVQIRDRGASGRMRVQNSIILVKNSWDVLYKP